MLLTFVVLGMAICAVWLPPISFREHGSIPPWAILFVIATGLGFAFGVLDWQALGILAVSLSVAEMSRRLTTSSARIGSTVVVVLIAVGLAFHFFPGFHNPIVVDAVITGPGAAPFTQYANFDKAAAGLVVLAYFCRRVESAHQVREMWASTALVVTATVMVLIAIGLTIDYFDFDPKLPSFTSSFLAINLLFTCVAEEAFFRGFVQERVARRLTANWQWLAIAFSSLLFGLAHLRGGTVFVLLATVLGFGCAVAYSKTRRIEAPIFVHFSFNAVHFLLFTYPLIQK